MGVAASLSVSIAIDGKLWGMIACHHGKARHVPHRVHMLCDVIGQIAAITISSLKIAAVAARLSHSIEALAEIGVRTRAVDDLLLGIAVGEPNPATLIDAEVCFCLWGGRVVVSRGNIAPEAVSQLASALGALDEERVISERLPEHFSTIAKAVALLSGILAVCCDVGRRGWIVWMRAEQIEHVRWAGKPDKLIKFGPNGPRLTPRGSFLEWREEVRGSSIPWDIGDIRIADALRSELNRIAGAHAIEMERARHQLLASLGHDLREPLHSISLAAQILQKRDGVGAQLGAKIETSSGRMSRLISKFWICRCFSRTLAWSLTMARSILSNCLKRQ
jgi:chemotaxis family two-component system sensor kinase Cph1